MSNKVNSTNKEYDKYLAAWQKCRLVAEGSEAVKDAGKTFLPMLSDQTPEDYTAYKKRAVFFEGTTRTIDGLTGMVFSKEPEIRSPENDDFMSTITPGFSPMKTFLKNLVAETNAVGRVGLLVDVGDQRNPHIAQYRAESILNWRIARKDGKQILSWVVLQETKDIHDGYETKHISQYRVLRLDEEGYYYQELWTKKEDTKAKGGQADFVIEPGYPLYPLKTGKKLEEIPFFFIGAKGNNPNPSRPPLIGMVNINLSHYMNSADLEHGRHFTGLPTPWAAGFKTDGQTLSIGSQKAWVTSKADAKAGFLEFTGKGLTSLETALKEKQDQMIVLGARMLEAPKAASESADNQRNRKQGESSILANIADSVSESVTKAVQFAAEWAGKNPTDYSIDLHKDFIALEANPNMIKNMMESLQAGLISWDTWFYNVKKAGLVQDGITADEEKKRIAADSAFLGDFTPPNGDDGDDGDGGTEPDPKQDDE